MYSSLPKIDGIIYALGGTMESSIESSVISPKTKSLGQWVLNNNFPPEYAGDDLQSFAFCYVSSWINFYYK